MEELTFHLENFEGPLDLLLALISKNKMDLHDIPILELIEQYTAVIRTVQSQRLDVASEFIEMAARLVEMKSYLLLPRSEEAERMKQELTGQLIEYELCRRMAAQLGTMAANTVVAVRNPARVEQDMTYTLRHDPSVLAQVWAGLMGRGSSRRAPDTERFEPIVTAPFVSVSSRVVHVLRGMVSGKMHRLRQLFLKSDGRSTTVATFLAILELVRHGRVRIGEDETLEMSREKLHLKREEREQQWT